MAIFGVGVMVGPTLGPTLGGYITDAFGWPWIFYINIPIGMLALALSLSFIQDSRYQVKAEKVDYPGLLLLAIGIGTLQTMLERGERLDWFDSQRGRDVRRDQRGFADRGSCGTSSRLSIRLWTSAS